MRVIVVGLGVQGEKRKRFAGEDFVASVDPTKPGAEYRDIREINLHAYDAALVCLPDEPKYEVIKYLLQHGKHVLVEKPLWCPTKSQLVELGELATEHQLVLYTAYNHRFEPSYAHTACFLKENKIGRVYRCRLFYGNGTARLVRNSEWRDQGAGVLPDLGSHLLDTLHFWFGEYITGFQCVDVQRHENRAPDHVLLHHRHHGISFTLEMSLLSWRNSFSAELVGSKGSIHLDSLCKWGPASLTFRERVLPSGRPPEHTEIQTREDPTWALEYQHFKSLVHMRRVQDPTKDLWLYDELSALSRAALKKEDVCLN